MSSKHTYLALSDTLTTFFFVPLTDIFISMARNTNSKKSHRRRRKWNRIAFGRRVSELKERSKGECEKMRTENFHWLYMWGAFTIVSDLFMFIVFYYYLIPSFTGWCDCEFIFVDCGNCNSEWIQITWKFESHPQVLNTEFNDICFRCIIKRIITIHKS